MTDTLWEEAPLVSRTPKCAWYKVLHWVALVVAIPCVVWFGTCADGFGLLIYLPKITIPIFVVTVLASVLDRPKSLEEAERLLRIALTPLLFAAAMIAYGMLLWNRSGHTRSHTGGPVLALVCLQVLFSLLGVIVNRRRWILLTACGVFMVWVSLSIGFIVGMMVSGDWL